MSYEAWGEPEDDYCSVDRLLEEGWLPADKISAALSAVIDERVRQESVEGWTPVHDDDHDQGQLALAAACYALSGGAGDDRRRMLLQGPHADLITADIWPWTPEYWKPKDRRRDLVRAAALLIAEIERIDRATSKAKDDANAP